MSKFLKFLLVLLLLGLASGKAYGAAAVDSETSFNGITTPTSVSREWLGADRSGSSHGMQDQMKIFYKAGAYMPKDSFLKFEFSNGLNVDLDATPYLCSVNSTPIGYTGNSSNLTFKLSGYNVEKNAVLWMANNSTTCGATTESAAYTTTGDNIDIKLVKNISTNTKLGASVSGSTTDGGTVLTDTSASVDFFQVKNEYSITDPTVTTKYVRIEDSLKKFGASGATSGDTKVTGNSFATTDDFNNSFDVGASGALGSTNDSATIIVSGATMSGLSRLCWNDSTCSSTSTSTFTINTSTNQATISKKAASQVIGDWNKALTFVFDGTTALSARTYKATIDLDFYASDHADRTAVLDDKAYLVLTFEGTVVYLPLIKVNASKGEETYIKLQSSSTSSSSTANKVITTILADDGTLVTKELGAITPGTPFSVTGTELQTAITDAGKTVSGSNGFAAILYVNTSEGDLYVYNNICNASGCKRQATRTKQNVDGTSATNTIYSE